MTKALHDMEASIAVGPICVSLGGIPFNNHHIEYWKKRAVDAEARLAILPQRMPVAWRWRHVNDPNFAWHYQETAIGNANEYLQVEPLYAFSRPDNQP